MSKKNYLNILQEATSTLHKGMSILYPTDTVWGIGCDATNEEAVKRIYSIKQRDESKSLILLVDSLKMLQEIIKDIPTPAIDIIYKSKQPTTIIYRNPINLASNVIANDNTVAIRIVQDVFCQNLIKEFGKPIVSTSANISNKTTPKSYSEISTAIKNQVDYIVNLKQDIVMDSASKIIAITEHGEINILR